ncbi:MAG: hypothetical protein AB1641_14230 [Thermodesulfobacteriota bacterium]
MDIISKPHYFSIVVAVLFIITAYLFTTAYQRHASNQQRAAAAAVQMRLLTLHEEEMTRRKQASARARRFVAKAKTVGLSQDKWAVYGVNIQESVTFAELELILKQTVNARAYYFKPITLQIKSKAAAKLDDRNESTAKPASAGPPSPPASASASADKPDQGDLLLTLKGAFLVRTR